METARHRTSGTATRVNRLIALLLYRASKPTVEVSGCPQAFCWNQRYQKSCPEAPFSFPFGRLREASAGSRHSVDWRPYSVGAEDYYPCRKDAKANWPATTPDAARRAVRKVASARCPKRNIPARSVGRTRLRVARIAGQS